MVSKALVLSCLVVVVYGEFQCTVEPQAPKTKSFTDIVSVFTDEFQVKSLMSTESGETNIIQEYFTKIPGTKNKDVKGMFKILSEIPKACYYRGFLKKPATLIYTFGAAETTCQQSTEKDCAELIHLNDVDDVTSYKKFPLGPSALWLEADKKTSNQPVYIGKRNRRGMDVDTWQQCIYKSEGSIRITYYAVENNWKTVEEGIGLIQTPLAIEIFGETTKPINRTYEFYDYQEFAPKIKFEPPVGAGCKDRTAAGFRPTIASSFKFKGVFADDTWYDRYGRQDVKQFYMGVNSNQKIYSVDTFHNHRWMQWIADFNEGVTYTFKFDTKGEKSSCSIGALSNMPYDVKRHGISYIFVSPSNIFDLGKSKLYFMGVRMFENIQVDAYETIIDNQDIFLLGKTYKKVVITYYFDSNQVKYAEHGDFAPANQTLVQLMFTLYGKNGYVSNSKLRIFQWRETRYSANLSPCFSGEGKKALVVEVQQKTNYTYLENHFLRIGDAMREYIVNKYGISGIRVTHFRQVLTRGSFYLHFDIIGQPAAISKFIMNGYTYPADTDEPLHNVETASECAQRCIDRSECLSFFFSPFKSKCFLSKNKNALPRTDKHALRSIQFHHYIRESAPSHVQISNEKLLKKLSEDVKNNIRLTVDSSDHFGRITMLPMTVTRLWVNSEFTRHPEVPLDYSKIDDKYSLKENTAGSNMFYTKASSQYHCLLHCNMEDDCESVSYCMGSKICAGSSKRIDSVDGDNAKYVEEHLNCALFNRPYIGEYFRLNGVSQMKADYTKTDVATEDTCAKMCTKHTKFRCESYQYCKANKDCLLFDDQDVLQNATDTDLGYDCITGSRYYSFDFTLLSYKNITKYSGEIISGESQENCTETCFFNDNCKQIDYCPSDKTCILHQDSDDTVKEFKLPKTQCSILRKINSKSGHITPGHITPGHKPVPPKKEEATKEEEKGITSGGMAGLCIGMLIVGAILVVVIYGAVITMKKRSSVNNDISIAYAKHDE